MVEAFSRRSPPYSRLALILCVPEIGFESCFQIPRALLAGEVLFHSTCIFSALRSPGLSLVSSESRHWFLEVGCSTVASAVLFEASKTQAVAEMNPEEVVALIDAAGGVLGAVHKVADEFNTLFGKVNDVRQKVRWLAITVVNMSPKQSLLIDDNWFDSGRFWTQPFGSIHPGRAQTFYVCDKDGSVFTGVSGGVGLTVSEKSGPKFTEGGHTQWVCSFSNPFVGSIKCLTRWKGFGIKPLFEEMSEAKIVYDPRCGCYLKDDNHIFFVWKDPANQW